MIFKNAISHDFHKVSSRITKVRKVPVDQLISGAVKQYIDYVKSDSNNDTDQQLLPMLNNASEQNSSSDGEKYKINGISIFISKDLLIIE